MLLITTKDTWIKTEMKVTNSDDTYREWKRKKMKISIQRKIDWLNFIEVFVRSLSFLFEEAPRAPHTHFIFQIIFCLCLCIHWNYVIEFSIDFLFMNFISGKLFFSTQLTVLYSSKWCTTVYCQSSGFQIHCLNVSIWLLGERAKLLISNNPNATKNVYLNPFEFNYLEWKK